jgi:hypothetical protein
MEPSGGAHGEFQLAGPTHNLGYEPDTFSVKPVLAVPIAVLITGVIAFVFTWLLFANIFDPKINNPEPTFDAAAKRNAEPLNDRLGRISSSDPNAEFQQPRLEGLVKTEKIKPDPNKDYAITAEFSPTQPTKEGNSPRLHADDLRAERIKELNTTDPAPGGGPRVPIDQAIADLVKGKLLPARQGALPLDPDPNWDRPKESNGGSAKLPDPPKPAAPKKESDKKEPEKKQPEGKGDEPGKK